MYLVSPDHCSQSFTQKMGTKMHHRVLHAFQSPVRDLCLLGNAYLGMFSGNTCPLIKESPRPAQRP